VTTVRGGLHAKKNDKKTLIKHRNNTFEQTCHFEQKVPSRPEGPSLLRSTCKQNMSRYILTIWKTGSNQGVRDIIPGVLEVSVLMTGNWSIYYSSMPFFVSFRDGL